MGLVSCSDKLELEPFDALDASQAFETKTDFNLALKGAYASFRDDNYYGGEFYLIPEVISDNVIICSEGRFSYQDYYLFNTNGNIAWLNFWRAAYVGIMRANHIIENIDNLEDGDFKNNILGQAYAIRAMAHFDLARVYAKAPQFASASDLGIAYITGTDAGNQPARVSVSETFAAILADFDAAVPLIDTDNGTGFMNLATVQGLRARYFLYVGNNASAITAANAAVAASVNGGVSSRANFPDIWDDLTENGVIFKLINTDLDLVRVGVVYNQASPEGIRSEYVPDFDFYSQFKGNDIRSTWFETSDFAGSSFNHITKYLQRPGSNQAIVDMKVLRWSEVYLTRAEAKAATGDDAGALADLNTVRAERYNGFVSGGETGAALAAAIQLERRLELAFEGHRMFDLKRQGLPINRSNNGDYSDGTGINPDASVLTLPASSDKFQMPVPQEEMNANPNMQPNPSNG